MTKLLKKGGAEFESKRLTYSCRNYRDCDDDGYTDPDPAARRPLNFEHLARADDFVSRDEYAGCTAVFHLSIALAHHDFVSIGP